MNAKRKNESRKTALLVVALLVIAVVSFGYIRLLNRTVSMDILSNVEEIAVHDCYAVYEFLVNEWSDLLYDYSQMRASSPLL